MTAAEELLIALAERAMQNYQGPIRPGELQDLIVMVKAEAEAATKPPTGRTFTAEQYHAAFDEHGKPKGA